MFSWSFVVFSQLGCLVGVDAVWLGFGCLLGFGVFSWTRGAYLDLLCLVELLVLGWNRY